MAVYQPLADQEASSLYELDRTHWLHPQGDLGAAPGTIPQVAFSHGAGATLTDIHGREYIDALAALWNVNVGYGRAVLADAAAAQMRTLAFSNAYGGFGHEPAIRLAARLAELAPGDLETTFFTSGGAEANESAFKLARLYWRVKGQPDRVKIVSRLRGYHGLTYGATSATGLPVFWKDAGPLAPGFVHVAAPDPYRFDPAGGAATPGAAYAGELESLIVREGPETVAAVVAEPVQGAGGVIVPPPDYFPLVRQVCDRHGVLLIADEVITGFGRTGRWFAMEHWGVAPDLMVFAKGITSGYLPLGGVMMTAEVHRTLRAFHGALPHGFTYSGHPTACAVALRNLRIIEEEGLVARAEVLGDRLLAQLEGLKAHHQVVGHVRGLGLLAGVELVRDRATRESFDPSWGVGRQVFQGMLAEGVIVRALTGDVIALCPPLVITEEQLDRVVDVLDRTIGQVAATL